MADESDGSDRTMRDTFRVWNFDAVEREVVLRSSDDQYVAVPLPEEDPEVFERLEGSSGTVDATLVESERTGGSWQVSEVHAVTESE